MATSDKAAAKARVDAARRALDDDIGELTGRLPGGTQIAAAGGAGGVGLTLLGIAANVAKKQMEKSRREKALSAEAAIQAKAIATALVAARAAESPPAAAPAHAPAPRPAPAPSPVPATAAVPVATGDDGPPWGIILLLVALVAAVVAAVTRQDDEDLWLTPEG